jgi:hypothetical protein
MPHPTRRDVIVRETRAKQSVIFIDAPASEDVLEELASAIGMRFLGISSADFLKRDESERVALVVICPRTELERRHSLRLLFASVRKARELCGTAQTIVLLPLRDQLCEKDLKEKYDCRVAPWQGFSVSKIAALMKHTLRDTTAKAELEIEFGKNNHLRLSNAHGSCELTLPGGRPPVLLRKLLEEDRAFSLTELALTLDCENLKCIQMSKSRLNRVFKSIPASLGVGLEIRSAGYRKGYWLSIVPK